MITAKERCFALSFESSENELARAAQIRAELERELQAVQARNVELERANADLLRQLDDTRRERSFQALKDDSQDSQAKEILHLRAELAKRDSDLLSAAAALQRTASQSMHMAQTLKAKLGELELAVATPRASQAGTVHEPAAAAVA